MRRVLVGIVVWGSGCAADGMGSTTPDVPVTLAFTSPTPHESFARDELSALTGGLIARIPVAVAFEGSPARIGLALGDVAQTDLAMGTGSVALDRDAGTLVATAYDADDLPVATASVDVTTMDVTPTDCHAALDLYKVAYTVGPTRMGVVDPITAEVPINGVAYRSIGAANPRTTQFADCKLILSLARATPILRAHNIVEVSDLGIYNYRCIGGGDPPCTNGISQHAYATAIDLAAFTDTDAVTSVVKTDWVIDPNSEDTCAAGVEPGKDAFLHEVICALKDAGTWNIVLTPNYNADHRDHFHVDLTPGSDFME